MELPRPLPEAAPTRAVGGWTLPDRWLPHMLLWPSLGALFLPLLLVILFAFLCFFCRWPSFLGR